jgi:hypothetical protein
MLTSPVARGAPGGPATLVVKLTAWLIGDGLGDERSAIEAAAVAFSDAVPTTGPDGGLF